jgi:class 3 adenylate cyclase
MANRTNRPPAYPISLRHRISTVLVSVLALIAIAVLIGLAIIAFQLFHTQTQIGALRDRSLPRLVKLSQLSQEASASIAIAPALSTNPTRFEFETLLSRIEDKTTSQTNLLGELGGLIADADALIALKRNSALLSANQIALTTVVRQQINIRKRLEKHYVTLRRFARIIESAPQEAPTSPATQHPTLRAILRLHAVLHDPVRARFSRNRREVRSEIDGLAKLVALDDSQFAPAERFVSYWFDQGDRIFEDKAVELSNAFKIKAFVEENSLIANRLLNSANSEFARANIRLTEQIGIVAAVTRMNLITMALVTLAFAVGAIFLWLMLQRRVFRRLENLRDALRMFAGSRQSELKDQVPDEIGEISRAMGDYMARISDQEDELQDKTRDLKRLSTRLAKYLSPQVYESIFAGKQQVTVSSTRKKLTVFFSDIVGFTEFSDQYESEELTQLLNTYLTEMSRIALDFGATIDKYIGDAIMVFFGDPDTKGVKEDAFRCVSMAITMRDRLDALNEEWRASGLSRPLVCRMGIHTGYCTVGNFGSDERMDYTIIGGTVNIASRLESVADTGEIVISYETFALVEDEIDCEERGKIEVKGIAYPVTTYSVQRLRDASANINQEFHEIQAGLRLEIDRDSMSSEDKRAALIALRRAIQHVKP